MWEVASYIVPLGIPLAEFQGWSRYDQALALAYRRREADRCTQCGQFRSDWVDENGKELRDPPLELKVGHCFGCASIGAEDDGAIDHKRGEHWTWAPWPASSPSDDAGLTVTG